MDIKFERRVPLVNACFHLHNFCVDQRMIREHRLKCNNNNCVQVQPSMREVSAVWSRKPTFNKRGHPVEYLNWIREGEMVELLSTNKTNKFFSQR